MTATLHTLPVAEQPHLSGEARCLGCGHEYVCVTPVGTVQNLECPQCHLYQAVLQGLTEPPAHTARFVCNCGGDLYYILADGCQCLKCGVMATGF